MTVRTVCFSAFIITLLGFVGPAGANDDRKAFQQYFRDHLQVTADRQTGDAVGQVFEGRIYAVDVKFNVAGLGSQGVLATIRNGKVVKLESDNSPGEMDDLASLIKPGFTIKTREDAKTFEAAINALYLGRFDDKDGHHLLNKGNQWILVRDESFGDYKGFLVTVDDAGQITGVEVSHELPVEKSDLNG